MGKIIDKDEMASLAARLSNAANMHPLASQAVIRDDTSYNWSVSKSNRTIINTIRQDVIKEAGINLTFKHEEVFVIESAEVIDEAAYLVFALKYSNIKNEVIVKLN